MFVNGLRPVDEGRWMDEGRGKMDEGGNGMRNAEKRTWNAEVGMRNAEVGMRKINGKKLRRWKKTGMVKLG